MKIPQSPSVTAPPTSYSSGLRAASPSRTSAPYKSPIRSNYSSSIQPPSMSYNTTTTSGKLTFKFHHQIFCNLVLSFFIAYTRTSPSPMKRVTTTYSPNNSSYSSTGPYISKSPSRVRNDSNGMQQSKSGYPSTYTPPYIPSRYLSPEALKAYLRLQRLNNA